MLERISAVSPVPVFALFETYLGHGIVAGSIASFEEQGRRSGELAARLLNGEDPAAIGIQPPVPSHCIADWQALRRWKIDADLLPADCEVRFREPTLWDRYRRPILLVLGVLLAQAAERRLQGNLDDKPKLVELFAKIDGQAERTGAITQRVRALVSSGEPRLQPVALCPLLEAVIQMVDSEVESRGCRITCALAGEDPTVLADPLQVQLVLVNLLQNATQSLCAGECEDRRVSVDVRYVDGQALEVSVTDRGPVVPPDRAADIFEPLYTDRSGGMGMGLSISRAIIEAHGGRLWHEPNPSGGAIFRFTLRVAGA